MKLKRFDWLPGLLLLVWSVFAVIGMVKCIDHTELQHQRVLQLQHKADSLSKRIMGFPSDYTLIGTQAEQKKFIGNAVEVNMARVLCEALCKTLIEL